MKKLLALVLVCLVCLSCFAEETAPAPFTFETTDLNGNPVTFEAFANAKVIMLNMWEIWCGPCVNEIPDIQKLYEAYAAQGLQVVGVSATYPEYALEFGIENGITYPLINWCEALAQFDTGYVPTTVFMDAQGNLLAEPIIGSNSYEGWEAIVTGLLAEDAE